MKPWMRWSLWTVLIVGSVVGVFRYFFIDFHTIPDDTSDPHNWANSPNLEPGDLALVWRGGEPHIGDMVRCADPTDPTKWMIARVIGTAGDRIEYVEGQLRINGFRVTTAGCQRNPRKVIDPSGGDVDMICYSEEIGGSKHDVQVAPNGPIANAEWKVEAGKLFLMTDNRSQPYSHDSREPEVAQRPEEECKQRLVVRLMSKAGWGDSERRMTFLF
jgi:signal peptidase I